MQLEHRIDFMGLISVSGADPNGDPRHAGIPRTDSDGCGVISPVCIKRKLRDRLSEMGEDILISPPEFNGDTLAKRASEIAPGGDYAARACRKWYDVRAFGQVFAFPGVRCPGVRGAVTVQAAYSVSPVEIVSMGITRCINSAGESRSGSVGTLHMVKYGLYVLKGSVNAFVAEKTGFTKEDAEKLKTALLHIFDNDSSASRPAGSMEIKRLYWWENNSKSGDVSTAKVFDSVSIIPAVSKPSCFADYIVTHSPIAGMQPEIFE